MPCDRRTELEVPGPFGSFPNGITAFREHPLDVRSKLGVCRLAHDRTQVPTDDVFGATAIVPGVRAIDEHVVFLRVQLRDEYRDPVSDECQTFFGRVSSVSPRGEPRIPGSKSCPQTVDARPVHLS